MILTDPTKLRLPCSPVLPENISEVITKLEQELEQSELLGRPGIGLAAPQIGLYQTAAIVRIPSSSGLIKINLINPKIDKFYDLIIVEKEGCLSFPGLEVKTQRYNEIVVKNGVFPYNFIATELLAICIQHEIEHFNGQKLLIDWIKR